MGFFGSVGKFLSNPNTLGVIADTLGGFAGQGPTWAQTTALRREREAERNKPYRFQNNNGDVVEVNPATGEQRVLYQDKPKPAGPPSWEEDAAWLESQGRADEAAEVRARGLLVPVSVADPVTREVRYQYVRPTALSGGGQAGGAAPPTATTKEAYDALPPGAEYIDPTGQRRRKGGAGQPGPRPFP